MNETARKALLGWVTSYAHGLTSALESSPLLPTKRQLKDLEVCELLLQFLLPSLALLLPIDPGKAPEPAPLAALSGSLDPALDQGEGAGRPAEAS